MATRTRRRAKIKNTVRGTVDRPRLVVYRSNKYLYGQVVNDAKGETVVSVNKLTDAAIAGQEIAQKALKKKINSVVFDRAGYKYHGKIKKFADAAREGGLKF